MGGKGEVWFSDSALWTECYSVKIDIWSPVSQEMDSMHSIVLFSVSYLTIIHNGEMQLLP